MKTGFILIPGAGMSDWLWKKLIPLLKCEVVTIDKRLEINTENNRLNARFSDCIENINKKIESSGFDKAIVVGHSGAGLLAGSIAKKNKNVSHVVFIAANIPKHGQTAVDVFPKEIQTKNIEAIKAQAKFDAIPMKQLENVFRNSFCNTCNEEDIEYILAQSYLPEPLCAITEKMDWSDYPDIPKTYIALTADNTLKIEAQEYLAMNLNIKDIRKIESDHLVMISNPKMLANELNSLI